jgi:molecular chaperone GrpE (heat shock protein)
LTAENLRLKSHEEESCTKVSELHAAIEEKERHALEVTCKVSSLEQLLAKDREAAKEKAQVRKAAHFLAFYNLISFLG